MTEAEILQITDAFGLAAKRARDSGFDAVQLHAAHGYLPSQFLSPFTNRRSDAWGGALENRLRFHFEIYKAIKKHAGPDFPVLLKLGVRDGFDGGLPFSDGQRAAVLLAEQGYDALEISQGLRGKWYSGTEFRTGIRSQEKEAYFRAWSRAVTSMVDVPVMLVGGLRTFRLMEEIVSSSDADYVSLCRPLIRECDLVNTWKTNPDYVPECISCNQCGEALKKGFTAHCVQAKRTV